tara:strand:+ start:1478 stop:2950 length:1473 start_codon:yes stop_codon:yes gene_type:complete
MSKPSIALSLKGIKQRGQALVYVIAMAGILGLTIAYIFNVGQITNEKTKLQNTTDAAAYSIVMVQSRDMNFKAYTNRAMVANHVAVAQAVALTSWTRWLEVFATNFQRITSSIPILNFITAGFSSASKGIAKVTEASMSVMVSAIDLILDTLETSQMAFHTATMIVAKQTFDEVVKANDPDVNAGLVATANNIKDFVSSHATFTTRWDPSVVRNKASSGSNKWKNNKYKMDEFRDITLQSRDGFTKGRNKTVLKFGGKALRFEVKALKEGKTQLTAGLNRSSYAPYYNWSAEDTFSFHLRKYKFSGWKMKWKSWKEIAPVGWGGAQSYKSFDDRVNWRFEFKSKNPNALKAAEYQFGYEKSIGTYSGLRKYYSVSQKGLIKGSGGITVLLEKPQSSGKGGIRTSQSIGLTRTGSPLDIESKGGFINNTLAAMAKAETYFVRPTDDKGNNTRTDKKREYGSAFNPYWQPRLIDIPASEEITMKVALGIPTS